MAEIRTEREGMPTPTPMPRSDVHAADNLGDRPADRLPAGHALPGGTPVRDVAAGPDAVVADDPEAVRSEIENTRERMSSTIDEIESVLTRKKEQIQDRLDVLSPVRDRPLPAAGIAFGAGLVLGLLTGGDDEADDHEHYTASRAHSLRTRMDVEGRYAGGMDDRAEMWEARARRLLRVAREQEEQIRDLQERYGALYSREVELGGWDDDEKAAGQLASSVSDFRDTVLHGLTGFLTDAFHQMGKGGSGGDPRA